MSVDLILSDDHGVVREGLRMLIEAQSDMRVVGEATDGHEAVHLVRMYRPDVLIIDGTMPGLNGIEATRHVRAICPSTQVVILSTQVSMEHVARALRAGALGYVLKRETGAAVVAAVRAAHAGRLYLSEQIAAAGDTLMLQPDVSPLDRLSDLEREVLQLVVESHDFDQIAVLIGLSPKTVKTYRSRMMRKLGVSDLPSLVKLAIQHHVTALE